MENVEKMNTAKDRHMKSCKDCAHCDVCRYNDGANKWCKHPEKCKHFKDKTLFVELPCKAGDTVYKICPISNRLKIGDMRDGRKVKTDCDRCAWRNCDCHDIGYQEECVNIVHSIEMKNEINILKCKKYFGQIYFLTLEEAEEKLKELKKQGIPICLENKE